MIWSTGNPFRSGNSCPRDSIGFGLSWGREITSLRDILLKRRGLAGLAEAETPAPTGIGKGEAMIYIWLRWARLTTRRYGFRALFTSYRPRRAGTGRGLRQNPLGRQHGWGTSAMYLIRQVQLERGLVVDAGMLL